jgi:hypothetical protein
MDDDDGSDVTRIMEDVLDTPTRSEWSVKGPSIRRSADPLKAGGPGSSRLQRWSPRRLSRWH